MADTIYKVQDPQGKMREISGPEGASDEEIIAQAQKLFAPPSIKDRLTAAAVRGGLTFGAPGALASGAKEISNIVGEDYEKLAYGAGGAITDVATQKGLSPELAAGAGLATNVGIQALPAFAGFGAAKAAPVLENTGRWLMQSAAKPNVSARQSGEARRAITTMLEKGINPTSAGMEATKMKVANLETSIQSILENSPKTVSKTEVSGAIKTAFDDVRLNLENVKNVKDIENALSDFLNHPALKKSGEDIPVAIANRMKQAFYKELGGKSYLPGAAPSAYDVGEKALAAGLRSGVEKAVPQVAPSLKEQSELLNVIKVLKPRVGAAANQNVVGLGVLSPSMERIAIWMADRYPWFKAMLARTLYTGAEPITGAAGVVGGALAGEALTKKLESP